MGVIKRCQCYGIVIPHPHNHIFKRIPGGSAIKARELSIPTSQQSIFTTPYITAERKLYRNEKFGYQFQYPADINIEEAVNVIKLNRPFLYNSDNYENNFWMTIAVISKNPDETLENLFISSYCNAIEESAYTQDVNESITNCKIRLAQTKREFQIQGKKAIQVEFIDYVSSEIITMIDNEDEVIVFSLGESGEEGSGHSDQALATLDEILSTLHIF